jgi:hypothetical protein
MYEPAHTHLTVHAFYYKHLHVSVTSVTIVKVYSINIRSTKDVYDEILQNLIHCKNSIKFLRSSSNHDKV